MLRMVIEDHGTMKAAADEMTAAGKNVRKAMDYAALSVAVETEAKCRQDIKSAGKFGPAWTSALKSRVSKTRTGVQVKTTIAGRGFGGRRWRVFQEGATVQGHPLIWIPLSFSSAARIPLSKYLGDLVLVERANGRPPLLISTLDHKPKYFGVPTVTIPKKFHLVEIATEVGMDIGNRYLKEFGQLNG